MSSQRKMGSPTANRVNRVGDEFRSLGYEIEKRIRRLLIRKRYQFHDWVTPHTYRHPELEGVEGFIQVVETDVPFYLVHFPTKGETYWFPEPELTRTRRASNEPWTPQAEQAPGAQRAPGVQQAPPAPGTQPAPQGQAAPPTQSGMPGPEQSAPPAP